MTLATYLNVVASLDACTRANACGAMKIIEDLARFDRVIVETRPDVIVETGTALGGSSRWFAEHDVDVVTVDLEPDPTVLYRRTGPVLIENVHSRVTYLVGSSVDEHTVETITGLVAGRRATVVLDSDHSTRHVWREIELYAPLVSSGCHLVVEDGILRWLGHGYNGDPLTAIEYLLAFDERFERDEEIEKMSEVTLYPAGWWRRL